MPRSAFIVKTDGIWTSVFAKLEKLDKFHPLHDQLILLASEIGERDGKNAPSEPGFST